MMRHLIVAIHGRVVPDVGYPPLLLVFPVLLKKIRLALLLGLNHERVQPEVQREEPRVGMVEEWRCFGEE